MAFIWWWIQSFAACWLSLLSAKVLFVMSLRVPPKVACMKRRAAWRWPGRWRVALLAEALYKSSW